MGLDMYLKKQTYIWATDKNKLQITGIDVDPKKVSSIVEDVMYWRKANAIHKWFVDNVQQGEDDCREYDVSHRQLQELLDTVSRVLKYGNEAPDLLPTQSGFFFGGNEFDDYYWQDLKDTKKVLTELLKNNNNDNFTYQSSW